jgi:hypothetical protein
VTNLKNFARRTKLFATGVVDRTRRRTVRRSNQNKQQEKIEAKKEGIQ